MRDITAETGIRRYLRYFIEFLATEAFAYNNHLIRERNSGALRLFFMDNRKRNARCTVLITS
jgi:hypothetical protein